MAPSHRALIEAILNDDELASLLQLSGAEALGEARAACDRNTLEGTELPVFGPCAVTPAVLAYRSSWALAA